MSLSADNRAIWERPDIVAEYADPSAGLHPAESAVFERYGTDLINKDVLDLGIGCGRTTAWLSSKASVYVGLDYSHEMVRVCKEKLEKHDVRWGDARDLSAFADESFDFVLFSFNGIDCVNHADRYQILREVHRVLRRGGVFSFSSHNLAYTLKRSALKDTFRFGFFSGGSSKSIVAALSYLRRASIRLFNHLKNAQKQHRGNGYALLNDSAHDFVIVGYNVDLATQTLQLRETAFEGTLEVIDSFGQQVGSDTSAAPWLQYTVRK